MLCTQRFLNAALLAHIGGLGLCIPASVASVALLAVEIAKIAESLRNNRVLRPQPFLEGWQGALKQRLSLHVVASLSVDLGKIAESLRNINVLWFEFFF